jgi:hypothetical protein
VTAAGYAELVEKAMVNILHAAGHTDVIHCIPSFGPVSMQVDNDGKQWAVCSCGEIEEIPDGIESQLKSAGAPVAADPVQPGLPLIDPSQIATPEMLEAHLLDVIQRLETGQLFERECIEAEYEARMAWERAKAKAIVKGGGAADVREARAIEEHGDLLDAWRRAEMMRKATQAAMHNLRSALSGYQTVARSVLTTYQAGGSPGPNRQMGRN